MPDADHVPCHPPHQPAVARRTMLRAAALCGVAITAACGSDLDTAAGSDGLGRAADVPVGGGAIYDDSQTVVTQPTEGEFKAFSSICTHSGCQVSSVTQTINCDCHGSRYSLEDGSVVDGPAPSPLPAKKVTVKGGDLLLG